MPTTFEDPSLMYNESDGLMDFFGGSWEITPNATFTDLGSEGGASSQNANPVNPPPKTNTQVSRQSQGPNCGHQDPNVKNKAKPQQPNLFETLVFRNHVMSNMMVPLSPYSGYSDATALGNGSGLDWSPPMMSMGGVNGSPQMVDPYTNMMLLQRMKRARLSPYLGSMSLDNSMVNNGFPMMPMSMMPRPRPAKIPLSPAIKQPEKVGESTSETIKEPTRPLILPTSMFKSTPTTTNTTTTIAAAPTVAKPPPRAIEPPPRSTSLEDNIEQNLRAFLRETRDLEWENVTVLELKRILRQYELNATGKKADLMSRITKIRELYRHLEEGPSPKKILKKEKEAIIEKRADSSPDTMGSDNGVGSSGNVKHLNETCLDDLFASALELPGDVIFTSDLSSKKQ